MHVCVTDEDKFGPPCPWGLELAGSQCVWLHRPLPKTQRGPLPATGLRRPQGEEAPPPCPPRPAGGSSAPGSAQAAGLGRPLPPLHAAGLVFSGSRRQCEPRPVLPTAGARTPHSRGDDDAGVYFRTALATIPNSPHAQSRPQAEPLLAPSLASPLASLGRARTSGSAAPCGLHGRRRQQPVRRGFSPQRSPSQGSVLDSWVG